MTYRRDSDIFFPYGEMKPGGKISDESGIMKATSSRSKDDRKLVAWVVSHCKTQSQREKYVEVKKVKIRMNKICSIFSHSYDS